MAQSRCRFRDLAGILRGERGGGRTKLLQHEGRRTAAVRHSTFEIDESGLMVTEFQLTERLRRVQDPELGRSLGDLKMLKGVTLSANGALVAIELPTPAYPGRERITAAIEQALREVAPEVAAQVEFTSVVKGKNTGGAIGLKVKNVIAVGSGKGGVGKSTVAASLAYGLQHFGATVGLMDADVYGPSIPHLVGSHGVPAAIKLQMPDGKTIDRIQPVEANGLKVISMGYFVKADQAVIWRGPMLHRAITQFLQDTDWGELDYLVIDMPPGTGDVSLTLSQLLGLAGAVIVCTPQQVALLDAVKAISMFRQVKIPVLGMVENMSGDVFGRGGAKAQAATSGIPVLGEIPMEAQIRIEGDAGRIANLLDAHSPSRQPILDMCQRVAMQVAKSLLESPTMPTLEIL